MQGTMFILNGENGQIGVEYKNGLFPQIPNYHKRDSWFLLTEGITDDIIVDDRTTVREIRRGQYKRLVEISRNTLVYPHEFNSNCRETSYTFKVMIKANVYVNDPIKFCANAKNISVKDFLNNQFSLDVKAITRKYSILNYNGIDEELTRVLTASVVSDDTSGLTYQVITVMTIKHEMTMAAGEIAMHHKTKTYADAIWEQAAQGIITDVEAIRSIEEYEKQNDNEKFNMLLKLRDEGFITDADISDQAQSFLQFSHSSNNKSLEQLDTSSVDELFDEGD